MSTVDEIIRRIHETGQVVGRSGKVYKYSSGLDPEEGKFVHNIIRDDPEIVRTLEVGCAYGLSTLNICSALQGRAGASHTIIDPAENTIWDGVGIKNLEEAGISFFELIEEGSEFALPSLMKRMEGQFDFVFVDGMHTFDHTLLDCFYCTRLLRVGGYLAIDDAYWLSVRRAISFISNYPCYEIIGALQTKKEDFYGWRSWKRIVVQSVSTLMSPIHRTTWAKILSPRLHRGLFEDRLSRVVALKKVSEDRRSELWHDDGF